ncbi:hypothetical protein BJ875DRAFT_392851 [Amylocarpus encephaloides]|uniref:DUF1750-domain-containing protein n=1 Tax=Amylocarpus encephaloides TaxID=45428 RepID=A0A9P8C9C2_9HELO|nr:hypothetical protein BJ875DRAFT_392851 [Amylocarpus encephaloides]
MQDPSQGIAPELKAHVHLVSTYRFPALLSLHPDKVAEWLLGAPKIARDQAPFYWTYLDHPAPGNILLTWQSQALGTEFPSDGYVWAPREESFQLEVRGYTLEMYHYKTGYSTGEPLAMHARRRYRLLPSKQPRPGTPVPDPSLWIIHYGHAELGDRMPSNIIPIDIRLQNTINTRTYLHAQGQIVQKEFMLNDRQNWPQIAFPRNQPRSGPMYGASAAPMRVPQSMAYPPQHATAGPPAKRARTQASANPAMANNSVAVHEVDDEEDTSRGDFFDQTSPRDISRSRYTQNHGWMEEILSSPYSINQLVPADLGLGVRGHLVSLTDGIFDAPYDPDKDVVKNSYVGRLDLEKAQEFRRRAEDHVAKTNKEMEKLKAKHAKRLAKFQKGSLITRAEKDLRNAANDPADMGPEYWRLEGRIDTEENEDGVVVEQNPSKVSDILAQVEASLGRHAAVVQELICVQKGGYEEPAPIPSPQAPAAQSPQISPPNSNNGSHNSGVLVGDADLEMGGSAAGLLDQFHIGLSSHSTPGISFSTPQPHIQAPYSTGTPTNMLTASPQPSGLTPQPQTRQSDVNMAGSGFPPGQPPADTTGDWVVVPPGGLSPTGNTSQSQSVHLATQSTPAIVPTVATPASAPIMNNPSPLPTASSNQTPLPDFHASPTDFPDLGDLDSAGDAMASYGEDLTSVGGDLGDLAMDMDGAMDDSAFGEAFHGVEQRGEGDNDGDGL